MPKRSSKPRDLNAMAAAIVTQATDDGPDGETDASKNPHAVALGRLGGKRGGPARAEKLTANERSDIARRAAQARWADKGKDV